MAKKLITEEQMQKQQLWKRHIEEWSKKGITGYSPDTFHDMLK